MVTVTVLRGFFDLKRKVDRETGDVFQATEERAAQIMAALPGYVTVQAAQEIDPKMTVAQLRELAASRGIDIPKGAKKADIIKLLEE